MNKWIDKKRKKLIVNTSKVKQRFGIRKLTTGVTSVLLGAFLIWGGAATAQAAEGTPTNDNEESSNISNDSSNIKDVKEVTLPASQESADKTNVAPSTTNSPQEAEQPAPTTINEKKMIKRSYKVLMLQIKKMNLLIKIKIMKISSPQFSKFRIINKLILIF